MEFSSVEREAPSSTTSFVELDNFLRQRGTTSSAETSRPVASLETRPVAPKRVEPIAGRTDSFPPVRPRSAAKESDPDANRYVREPGAQDACLAAAAQIKNAWIDELWNHSSELQLLRPRILDDRAAVKRQRVWLGVLGILLVLSTIALGLVLSWYLPLKNKADGGQKTT